MCGDKSRLYTQNGSSILDLASKIDACQHDVLRVMIQTAEAQVETLEEQHSCSCNLGWKSQGFADLLHLGLIVLA